MFVLARVAEAGGWWRTGSPYRGIQKKAMDIAVEKINAKGGIKGRPLQIVAEDSKSEPKDSAQIAQKFTSDAKIVATENYFDRDKDFTGVLTTLRGSRPDALYIATMYNDGALMSKQREKLGWNDVAVFGPGSLYSPKLLELGGSSVEGLRTSSIFMITDSRPEVQEFIKTFKTRNNGVDPNMFAAIAYDAINIMANAIEKAGTDRKAIRDELAKMKNYVGMTGKFGFTERRDVKRDYHYLIVKSGAWTLLDK